MNGYYIHTCANIDELESFIAEHRLDEKGYIKEISYGYPDGHVCITFYKDF